MTMKRLLFTLVLSGSAVLLSADIPPERFEPDFSHCDVYRGILRNIPVSGWWKLKKVENSSGNPQNDTGRRERWFAMEFDDSSWSRELVPGNLHEPFTDPKPDRKTRNWGGVAYFRRTVELPPLKKNERVILRFDDLTGSAEIYFNGKKAGQKTFTKGLKNQHSGTWFPDLFDVTDFARSGKNTIAVRFYHNGKMSVAPWSDNGPAIGILGNVWLELRPAAWSRTILIDPQKDLRTIRAEILMEGSADTGDTGGWTAEVSEVKSGRKVAQGKFSAPYTEDGKRRVSLRLTIPDAVPWTPESPFLYMLTLRNARGEITGAQRFGMRTFEVKNGDFLLNGIPVMLRGLTTGLIERGRNRAYLMNVNPGNAFRRYLQRLKELNVNHMRLHTARTTPIGYDLFDELGFIITDEIDYPLTMLPNPKRADEIAIAGMEEASFQDGTLKPDYVARLKKRIWEIYSHPSICTFSFGNEIRNVQDRTGRVLNNTYKVYRSIDKQSRPCTLSSGRYKKDTTNLRELRESDTTDYIDPHDYSGSINSSPLAYVETVARQFIQAMKKLYDPPLPIINGETVYYASHYYPGLYNPVWKQESDRQPDWDVLESLFSPRKGAARMTRGQQMMSYYWIRNCGLRNYIFHRDLWRGIQTDRILGAQRRLWPDWDGYENLTGDLFHLPRNLYPFDKLKFEPNAGFGMVREINAPVIGFLNDPHPNRWSGDQFTAAGMVINNSSAPIRDVSMLVTLRLNGHTLHSIRCSVAPEMAAGTKQEFPVTFRLPQTEGNGELVYQVYTGKELRNTRTLPLNLRNRETVIAPLKTAKKIALYDAGAVFAGLGPSTTDELLTAYGVKAEGIDSFRSLHRYDLLIIGANSLDSTVADNAGLIREYVRNGGRLLVFEQTVNGRIPFLPELRYTAVGPGQFSEILKFDHPAMKNMTQAEFFFWNQKDRSVYRSYITPFSRAALTLAGDTSQWGADNFGMDACHLRYGKGDVLLSQKEVTGLFRNDSGAAMYTRNILRTMTDDACRINAETFIALPPPKIKPPENRRKLYPVSLKPIANRAFADPVRGDGKGGWTDQGPDNDLAEMPVGRQKFAGIPFDITDPGKNDGCSCVMVSGRPEQKLAHRSRELMIGKRIRRLYFLHAGAWMQERSATPAGWYHIRYQSGKTVKIPLFPGKNISDWWSVSRDTATNAAIGWIRARKDNIVVGLNIFEWSNPVPDDPVASISLESRKETVLGLVGVTAELQ